MNIGTKFALITTGIAGSLWFLRFQLGKFIPDFVPELADPENPINKAAITWQRKVENFFGLKPNEKISDRFFNWLSGKPEKTNLKFTKLVDELISTTSEKYDVPENILAGIIKVESNGDPTLEGDNGFARGLMQIHKEALNDVNATYRTKFTWNTMYMADENIKVGANYLRLQFKRMGNWPDAIRAYNAGQKGANNGLAYDYLQKVERWT